MLRECDWCGGISRAERSIGDVEEGSLPRQRGKRSFAAVRRDVSSKRTCMREKRKDLKHHCLRNPNRLSRNVDREKAR